MNKNSLFSKILKNKFGNKFEEEMEDIQVDRVQNNQMNIQQWHEEQAKINAKLVEMQPSVSKILEEFMNFSDKITENYVLQFARQQMELYNLIADNYEYHKKTSEDMGDENYINAVYNYMEFMYSIADSLAIFGIEEITSPPGTPFDGAIHVTDSENFTVKTTVIKESIRSGFSYKGIIIQKEKVMI